MRALSKDRGHNAARPSCKQRQELPPSRALNTAVRALDDTRNRASPCIRLTRCSGYLSGSLSVCALLGELQPLCEFHPNALLARSSHIITVCRSWGPAGRGTCPPGKSEINEIQSVNPAPSPLPAHSAPTTPGKIPAGARGVAF
jgi:hypothetical protein